MSLVRVRWALGAPCINCTPCPWHTVLLFWLFRLAIFTWKYFQSRITSFNPLIHTQTSLQSYWVKNQVPLVQGLSLLRPTGLHPSTASDTTARAREGPRSDLSVLQAVALHLCCIHLENTDTQVTGFYLSAKLLSIALGNSSRNLDFGCAVSQLNLPV